MKTRKQIRDEYKQMKFKIGVFQIRNTVNNKIFVESSTDLVAIWNRIRFQLNAGLHPNAGLQNDWQEFGVGCFVYEILSEIKQDDTKTMDYKKEAKQLEEMYLEELQPFGDKGYNIRKAR
jgi:hypothetical protein